MVLVPCYRCNRYHRIVPLGNMLSHHKGIVLKSSRPSFLIKRAALGNLKASFHCTHWHRFFPLKKAPPFSPSLSSIVFTPPSVPPVLGDRNPQGREDVTALRCSEPLRSKVGGASKPFAILCGMGPPGNSSL